MMKLKWQFGEPEENLICEVKKILGHKTLSDLLQEIPPTIPYSDSQEAKLSIHKLGYMVWQVSYWVYKCPKKKNFEKMTILYTTEPSLELALWEMEKEIKKFIK